MLDDAALCALVAASYDTTPIATVAGDVRLVLTGDVLCIPGTRVGVLADWMRDLDAAEITDPVLGRCHAGCLAGADAIAAWLIAGRRPTEWPRVIVGHSLGGGIASLLAAIHVLAGQPLDRLVTFGSMRSCADPTLPGILAHVPGAHYWHYGDPVPDLPPDPYQHWRVPTMVGAPEWWPVDIPDHYMTAYVAAMREIPVPAVPASMEKST